MMYMMARPLVLNAPPTAWFNNFLSSTILENKLSSSNILGNLYFYNSIPMPRLNVLYIPVSNYCCCKGPYQVCVEGALKTLTHQNTVSECQVRPMIQYDRLAADWTTKQTF